MFGRIISKVFSDSVWYIISLWRDFMYRVRMNDVIDHLDQPRSEDLKVLLQSRSPRGKNIVVRRIAVSTFTKPKEDLRVFHPLPLLKAYLSFQRRKVIELLSKGTWEIAGLLSGWSRWLMSFILTRYIESRYSCKIYQTQSESTVEIIHPNIDRLCYIEMVQLLMKVWMRSTQ